ncbi:hypothetical protein KGA66_28505 [Actinocrinis puniceicyclus]|uniref:Uncharacterized protein n=1 Tax=Actinocrinis puniceicyclus TaxID=977794 RepID=A0A8J7WXP4_9ACTN|nr:hypothetical protein [Actinocrinis puniceicyclus]MBS2967009.1 hypothetical protein [Actinocrinis puniceicyclus]
MADRERSLIPTHGSPGVPHTVWLAPHGCTKSPIAAETSLPLWALERACAQFAPRGGNAAVLFGPGPAHTDQLPEPTRLAPDWLRAAEHTDLDEIRPPARTLTLTLALVLADPTPHEPDPDPRCAETFYRSLAAALRRDGIVLVHTHPHHTTTGLTDPAAAHIRAARAAGLLYTQHLVLVHHRLDTPTAARIRRPWLRPAAPVHRRVHTDLYAFTRHEDGDPR